MEDRLTIIPAKASAEIVVYPGAAPSTGSIATTVPRHIILRRRGDAWQRLRAFVADHSQQ